jgi:hypothetical protein
MFTLIFSRAGFEVLAEFSEFRGFAASDEGPVPVLIKRDYRCCDAVIAQNIQAPRSSSFSFLSK